MSRKELQQMENGFVYTLCIGYSVRPQIREHIFSAQEDSQKNQIPGQFLTPKRCRKEEEKNEQITFSNSRMLKGDSFGAKTNCSQNKNGHKNPEELRVEEKA